MIDGAVVLRGTMCAVRGGWGGIGHIEQVKTPSLCVWWRWRGVLLTRSGVVWGRDAGVVGGSGYL